MGLKQSDTTDLVDWVYYPKKNVYVNRWEPEVTLSDRLVKNNLMRPKTPATINRLLNDIAIHLRAKGKL